MDADFQEFFSVFSNENYFNIMMQILTFGPLNLKQLANMIDKSQSTTLSYIRILLKQKLIAFDTKASEQYWGKYYSLSDKGRKMFNKINELEKLFESSTPTTKNNLLCDSLHILTSLFSWPHNLGRYAAKFLNSHLEEIDQQTNPIKSFDKIIVALPSYNLTTASEWREFEEILDDCFNKLKKFQNTDVPRNQFLSLISLPITDIHPIKEKRNNPIKHE